MRHFGCGDDDDDDDDNNDDLADVLDLDDCGAGMSIRGYCIVSLGGWVGRSSGFQFSIGRSVFCSETEGDLGLVGGRRESGRNTRTLLYNRYR